KLGIGMVHQQFRLIPTHTVAENIILGLKEMGVILNYGRINKQLEEIIRFYGWSIPPNAKVWQLSAGEKQQVELLKALFRRADILILDEPTSVLTPQETLQLFNALRKMADEGRGIILITHKLDEVMRVSDRVTVMRRGKVVAVRKTLDVTPDELARLMVGKPLVTSFERKQESTAEYVLQVENLHVLDDKGLPAVRGVSLRIKKREILGIAGVTGNGQQELVETIAGLRKASAGRITIDGHDVTNKNSAEVIKQGVAYIPPEISKCIAFNMSVAENLVMKTYKYPPFSSKIILRWRSIKEKAQDLIQRFNIVTPSPNTRAGALSGGNLQRLILARELSLIPAHERPKLILAAYPTKGLDVAATEFVRRLLVENRDEGAAVLLVSEDLDEIMMLSDRVVVMYRGEIVGELSREQLEVETIGLMMMGVKRGGGAA
ncbi:MAG TPA: ABC transporter ATP-binding protein, partial [Aigarchaeota archaeon]|nr:ABC transporter ATP-binding protein [Aigarchaeota archaeon]